MTRRSILACIGAFLCLLLAGCGEAPDSAFGEGPRRIIVISLDTLGAGHLKSYGYERETAPNLSAVATDGARFANATAPSNWTLPSHASLFTGLYPARHGMTKEYHELGEGPVHLVDRLRDAGFTTAGFTGGAYLLPRHGFDRGFDHYECEERWDHSWQPTLDAARAWLGDHADADVFVFLHTYEIHAPYTAPMDYVRRFAERETAFRGQLVQLQELKKKDELTPDDVRMVIDHYDAGILYTDEILGGFLDWLAAEGLDENLLLVISSDHGEEFWQHGEHGHGEDLLGGEVTQVPLLVRMPDGAAAGAVIDHEASFMDILPTVIDAAGASRPDGLDAYSLMPELLGWGVDDEDRTARERRRLRPAGGDVAVGLCEGKGFIAAESRRWKAVVPRPGADDATHAIWPTLYDADADPDETAPLPVEGAVADLLRLAVERLAGEDAGSRYEAPEAPAMDEQTRRQLEALGY